MGDLIQRLPTDNTPLTAEEKENFNMLFPQEEQCQQPSQPQNQQKQPPPPQKLKREVFVLFSFVVVFFVLNLPYVKGLIVEYIPMCHKSWVLTHLVQAVVFAFVLWIVINSEYARA